MSGIGGDRPRRLWAGMLAFLPMFGADQAREEAEQAVRDGNALYQARQYESAGE